MRADFFHYDLPDEQIARHPLKERDGARLLMLGPSGISHHQVRDWPDWVEPGSLVVLNETRVMRARLRGVKQASGGSVELLLLGPDSGGETWLALGRSSKGLKPGQTICVGEGKIEIAESLADGSIKVRSVGELSLREIMHRFGNVPIPPYLKREAEAMDVERYQTVFAQKSGSVAAPTAGLHLTEPLLARLAARGVEFGKLTLHVGVGTFRPVSVENIADHVMHSEEMDVSPDLVQRIEAAKREGRPVVAVGTTVVRALETAAARGEGGRLSAFSGSTQLFITPGYDFRVVDALLTNFHMPQSTLLMLVAAFAGHAPTLGAYRAAVADGYRFLSYGDAMWIPCRGRKC
ncbi:MAG: tRNA preQ1(34) S-adenosylmethionine ribosyltransferase-isomerase QueA [Polyangiaceae bacterium]|nr:tRNA preQ1(34) S-adenosylmethionine ribosyltransferase-isomerase QueA [Polyangiaceae bacterium]